MFVWKDENIRRRGHGWHIKKIIKEIAYSHNILIGNCILLWIKDTHALSFEVVKNGPFPASFFFIFVFSILPTEPQPLPPLRLFTAELPLWNSFFSFLPMANRRSTENYQTFEPPDVYSVQSIESYMSIVCNICIKLLYIERVQFIESDMFIVRTMRSELWIIHFRNSLCNWTMVLLSRRRWTTILSQKSSMYGMLPFIIIWVWKT